MKKIFTMVAVAMMAMASTGCMSFLNRQLGFEYDANGFTQTFNQKAETRYLFEYEGVEYTVNPYQFLDKKDKKYFKEVKCEAWTGTKVLTNLDNEKLVDPVFREQHKSYVLAHQGDVNANEDFMVQNGVWNVQYFVDGKLVTREEFQKKLMGNIAPNEIYTKYLNSKKKK